MKTRVPEVPNPTWRCLGEVAFGLWTPTSLFPGFVLTIAFLVTWSPALFLESPSFGQERVPTEVDKGEAETAPKLMRSAVILPSRQIAAGSNFTCAVEDHHLWCWGDNSSYQQGTRDVDANGVPTPVPGIGQVNSVFVGLDHTCAVLETGNVKCWGSNGFQKLARAHEGKKYLPTLVEGVEGIVAGDAGTGHTCVLAADGKVWCWGLYYHHEYAQLIGLRHHKYTSKPTPVEGLEGATSVASGSLHNCAIDQDKQVWCWGHDNFGQLGIDGHTATGLRAEWVEELPDIKQIALGRWHSCALDIDGNAWCWGANNYGQLGDGTNDLDRRPVRVKDLKNAASISAGDYHTCATRKDGSSFCWGFNSSGQLGDGTKEDRNRPVKVKGLSKASAISGGDEHSCAVLSGGGFKCWGASSKGRLGNGDLEVEGERSRGVDIGQVRGVSAAWNHTCAATDEGKVVCWGEDLLSGYSEGFKWLRKHQFTTLPRLSRVVQIAVGPSHGCALRSNGSVYCWGSNNKGDLGTGGRKDPMPPAPVPGLQGVEEVAVGARHSCARTRKGRVYCWGTNFSGALGLGDTFRTRKPTRVRGVPSVQSVSMGSAHTCVLSKDGEVFCWGYGIEGQLGHGKREDSSVPVKVVGLSNVTEIAVGSQHACAIRDNGSVWCWGCNQNFALGDGTQKDRDTPVRVRGLEEASRGLVILHNGTCVRSGSGEVYCWGHHNRSPKKAGGLSGIVGVSSGLRHSCGLRSDKSLVCWGRNDEDQLGDVTRWRVTPQTVMPLRR